MGLPHVKTWLDMQRFMFPRHKWDEAESEIDGALELLKLPKASKILDMPCGEGRHSIALSHRGMKVTGVDITPRFLSEAKNRAQKVHVRVEWIEGDMLRYKRPGYYDAAINLYTSFGYFKDPSDDAKVIDNFFNALAPGGKLLMDMMSRELFLQSTPLLSEKKQEDGSIIRAEHRFRADDQSWLENKWSYISTHEQSYAELGLRLYSREELCSLLEQAGFVGLETYGDFDGRPYNLSAKHLLVLAKKPSKSKS